MSISTCLARSGSQSPSVARLLGKKSTQLLALLAVLAPAVAGAADPGDPLNGKFTIEEAVKGLSGAGKLTAVIETSLGSFTCELFEKDAPGTVANFVGLARGLRPYRDPVSGQWVKKPFYDGLIFHRVIPSFMIQGGDIKGNGTGEPGYTILDEKNDPHRFDRGGMLAMANRGPNTAGSQFFITEGATQMLDDGARPGAHYQIFGQCTPAELVQKIAAVPRDGRDKPFQDLKIVKVTVSRGGDAKAAPGAAKGAAKPAAKGTGTGGK
ncbi:MAG TPA: peptidylprolyl isomerase [Pseudomonadota bacterium]|nr:peptidylprolyl isomerase [Pseudomonadota bacterium]